MIRRNLHQRIDQLEAKDKTTLVVLSLHPDYLTNELIESATEAQTVVLLQNYKPLSPEQKEEMQRYYQLIGALRPGFVPCFTQGFT